jgi:hypothetical protein
VSDRRKHQARRYGVPRPIDPAWQLSQSECWALITRQAFAKRPVVEQRWRVRTDGGCVTVVRKVVKPQT